MGVDDTNPTADPASISDLAAAVADQRLDPARLAKEQKHEVNVAQETEIAHDHYAWEVLAKGFLETVARMVISATDAPDSVLDPLARGAIESLLKDETPRRGDANSGGRLLQKLAGDAASVEPGIDGAARYLTLFINESVEAWLRGVIVEFVTEYMPKIAGIGGGIETVQHLQEIIENALGGGRMVRRVLQPFISATAIVPAQWHVNKRYRPELLSAGAAIEAHLRGAFPIERLDEELARQGWSDERIALQIDNARKVLSVADAVYLFEHGTLTSVEAVDRIVTLGYERAAAETVVQIETSKRQDALFAPLISEAVSNYVNGDVDEFEMERWVKVATKSELDRFQIVETAKARRAVHVRRLSSTRLRAMVLAGVAAVVDFRKALEREGYPPDDVTLEELLLRIDLKQEHDLEKKHPTIAQLEAAVLAGTLSLDDFTRAPELADLTEQGRTVLISVLEAKLEKQAADAAEKAAADAARAAREAELEAKRARAFPALAEYRRAYVRGFIAREIYAAALDREKVTGDDATFLLAGADADREQFLADEEKAAQQRAAGDQRELSVSQLEQAVLAGRLELSAFDAYLAKVKYDDADRRLLVQVLTGKLEDQAAAATKRTEADRLATLRQSSVGDWERAVRLGVRTIAQYAAFLESLGMTAPARALIVDVLAAQVTADTEARQKRDARDQAAQRQGISLAQRRRAVIAGVRPKEFYADAIRAAGWPVDDQLADLDLLDVEIAAAAAARARRDVVIEQTRPSIVSVSQLERAFVLGLLSADELVVALEDRGASDADADLLLRLAAARVPDVRAGAQLHDQVQRELAAKGVSLPDLEAAVRRGIVTLDDYAGDLGNRGYAEDAVALLRQLLEEQVGVDVDGLRAKIETALTKGGADFTLEELTASLVAGELDTATYVSALEGHGAPRDAALVYARLRTATEGA